MVKKADKWIERVTWMRRMNGKVDVDRGKDGVGSSSETKYGVCSRSVVGRRT